MRHLLVTNYYPPKFGGIQNYLWELYRRLPADEFTVVTRRYPGWQAWDAAQDHQIVRVPQPVLTPEPWLLRQVRAEAERIDAELVMFDPAFLVGPLGPRLDIPYGLIVHGAEMTIPGRLPVTGAVMGDVLRKASLVVTAGEYSTAESEHAAGQSLPVVVVPPGVDTGRFRPLDAATRASARRQFGLDEHALVVLTLSRLVPRKGMDVLIRAAATLQYEFPSLVVLVAGGGRDRARLERVARSTQAPVRFLDRVPEADIATLYGLSDVFGMLCRVRLGGLEQEGFGIVFLEAASAGVPQLAGRSGGSAEAVTDGETGFVVDDPDDPDAVAHWLRRLLEDELLRERMGEMSRRRAVEEFRYDLLAERLHRAMIGAIRP